MDLNRKIIIINQLKTINYYKAGQNEHQILNSTSMEYVYTATKINYYPLVIMNLSEKWTIKHFNE